MAEGLTWDLDVAVAGGGPAGLAVANALLRVMPGLNIKVFESSEAYLPRGAGVALNTNGMLALEAINPAIVHRLYETGTITSGSYSYELATGERQPWSSSSDPRVARAEGRAPPLPWWVLQWNDIRKTLHAALPQEGVVEFACQVAACTEEQDQLSEQGTGSVHGTTGQGSSAPSAEDAPSAAAPRSLLRIARKRGSLDAHEALARARFVIGADGFFSRVRRMAIDPDALPTFNKRIVWRGSLGPDDWRSGRVQLPPFLADDPEGLRTAHLFTRPGAQALPDRIAFIYPAGDSGRLCWSLSADAELVRSMGLEALHSREQRSAVDGTGTSAVHESAAESGGVALQRVLAVYQGMAEPLLQLVRDTRPETVTEHGQFVHQPESYVQGAWARRNVVLVGDAAHSTLGDGQGANLAMEDAVVLAQCVREHGLSEQAFREYEARRMPRCQAMLWDKDPGTRTRLVAETCFEPLWQPQQLPAQPPCGSVEEARAWCREQAWRIAERKLEGRVFAPNKPNPNPGWMFR